MTGQGDSDTARGGKTDPGRFFEDFTLGETIRHATPRTVSEGDCSLYTALYGGRHVLESSAVFARALGFAGRPVDDLLVFHIVFGKTVPDISLNAVANLGYARCRFLAPVYPGDTLSATSKVIGLKENSNGRTGVVYVNSTGVNQRGETVLDYVRWVMVRKRDPETPTGADTVPEMETSVDTAAFRPGGDIDYAAYDPVLAGSPHFWEDYESGERIDHVDGMTIEEAEHMMATRLYQNTAKVHFDQHAADKGRFGRRLIYGGHIISLARSLSFNGLANACRILAINGGTHANPTFAGDTVYAASVVLEKAEIAGRGDAGALRLRLLAAKNRPFSDIPPEEWRAGGNADIVLDLDYWALLPRRAG